MAMIEINWRPGGRELRTFALLLLAFSGGFGAYLHWRAGAPMLTALIVWGAGGGIALLGLAAPPAIRPIYQLLMLATLPIGWVVSHVLLALIYYGLLTPIGLVMRMTGRDPMQRALEPEGPSYWVRRGPAPDVKRYFRQS